MYLLLGLLPVLCFLLALVSLDSFRLVRLRVVLGLLIFGGLAALASLVVNRFIGAQLDLDATHFARYVAPPVEELLKGAIVAYLLIRRRIGFLVDAAICGFAVGAGFAAVENLYFLGVLTDSRPAVWLVRGFGTAIMHGGVTASLAIVARAWADRTKGAGLRGLAPGWLLAVIVHSAFNHFFLAPDVTTLLILTFLPLFFVVVFRVSERHTRQWLGTGFDTDAELLELINTGRVSESRVGQFLQGLKNVYPKTVVADMVCLLRLRLELSIRAKGILILRKAGAEPVPDPEVAAKLEELAYLERSVGKAGLAALKPVFSFSDRDLWQYHMLGEVDRHSSTDR
jgi:protease PrsW